MRHQAKIKSVYRAAEGPACWQITGTPASIFNNLVMSPGEPGYELTDARTDWPVAGGMWQSRARRPRRRTPGFPPPPPAVAPRRWRQHRRGLGPPERLPPSPGVCTWAAPAPAPRQASLSGARQCGRARCPTTASSRSCGGRPSWSRGRQAERGRTADHRPWAGMEERGERARVRPQVGQHRCGAATWWSHKLTTLVKTQARPSVTCHAAAASRSPADWNKPGTDQSSVKDHERTPAHINPGPPGFWWHSPANVTSQLRWRLHVAGLSALRLPVRGRQYRGATDGGDHVTCGSRRRGEEPLLRSCTLIGRWSFSNGGSGRKIRADHRAENKQFRAGEELWSLWIWSHCVRIYCQSVVIWAFKQICRNTMLLPWIRSRDLIHKH